MKVVQFSVESLLRVAQTFPATPRIMADLGQLLRDPNSDLEEITNFLKQDTALAARLLRIANSAAFAQSESVASIEAAASLIGFQEIYRLVGAIAIDQFSSSTYPLYGFTGRRLRENALFVALIMEELANPADQDPHIAYAIGLFRSIGKLALEKLAADGDPIASFQSESDPDLVAWEKHSFETTANEATAVILHHWHFPQEIAQAIGHHFSPTERDEPMTHLLNLSANLADKSGYGFPGEKTYWLETNDAYRVTGIDPAHSQRYIDRAKKTFDRLSRVFG
jgi:HD-like signal output (HDOD) protein